MPITIVLLNPLVQVDKQEAGIVFQNIIPTIAFLLLQLVVVIDITVAVG